MQGRVHARGALPTRARQGYPEIAMNLWWADVVPAGTAQPKIMPQC